MFENIIHSFQKHGTYKIEKEQLLHTYLPKDIDVFFQIPIAIDESMYSTNTLNLFLHHLPKNINYTFVKTDLNQNYNEAMNKVSFGLINKPKSKYMRCRVLNFNKENKLFHSYIALSDSGYKVYLNDIKKLCLLLGTECNIRCSYCTFVNNSQKITKNDAFDLVDSIIALDKMKKIKILKLAGGEPTYYDWLPEFVDVILKNTQHLIVEVLTNGFNIDMLYELSKYDRIELRLHTPVEIYPTGDVLSLWGETDQNTFFKYYNKYYRNINNLTNMTNVVVTNENAHLFFDFKTNFEIECNVLVKTQIQTDRVDDIIVTKDNILKMYDVDLVLALWCYLNIMHTNLLEYDIANKCFYNSTCFQLNKTYIL